VPNRDVGVQVQGEVSSWLSFAGGVFDGVPDGTNASADTGGDVGTDAVGRVVVRPFRRAAGVAAGPLAGFGMHLGGSAGRQSGALPAFRTTAGRTFFRYAAGASADGARTRLTPAVFYYGGPFGAFAEHVRSRQAVTRSDTGTVVNDAWNVTMSYVLTGEAASERFVLPRRPFDRSSGGWGAVQVVARLSRMDIDDAAFARGLAEPGTAHRARAIAVGLNWFAASVLKAYLSYERTVFDVTAPPAIPTEQIVIVRVQLGV
jgi:phosphate-selective porin OprO/OprP